MDVEYLSRGRVEAVLARPILAAAPRDRPFRKMTVGLQVFIGGPKNLKPRPDLRRVFKMGRERGRPLLLARGEEEPFEESCLLQLKQQALYQFPVSASTCLGE